MAVAADIGERGKQKQPDKILGTNQARHGVLIVAGASEQKADIIMIAKCRMS
jgi:hypothetical protein